MTLDIGAGEMQTTGHRPPATELTGYGGQRGTVFSPEGYWKGPSLSSRLYMISHLPVRVAHVM